MGWSIRYRGGGGRRRRRWLRPLRPVRVDEPKLKPEPEPKESTRKTEKAVTKAKVRAKRKRSHDPFRPAKRATKAVVDDFNFKGFGWSFYKSFIFPTSCGVTLRLPLTINFDWFDRHPVLPSISSAAGFYYPWTAIAFISVSVPMDMIRFVVVQLWEWTVFLFAIVSVLGKVAAEASFRGITFPVMALLKLAETLASKALGESSKDSSVIKGEKDTNKVKKSGGWEFLGHSLPLPPLHRQIQYSANIQEREFCALSL